MVQSLAEISGDTFSTFVPSLPPNPTLQHSHWRIICLLRDCFAPDGLCQMAKLRSQPIFLIWGAHTSDYRKQSRRHWELTLGDHPRCKDPKQAWWTSEKLPCITSQVVPGPAHGHEAKEAGLSTSPCRPVLGTIILRSRTTIPGLTACQKGMMSYQSNRYYLDGWMNQQNIRGKGFQSVTTTIFLDQQWRHKSSWGYGNILLPCL